MKIWIEADGSRREGAGIGIPDVHEAGASGIFRKGENTSLKDNDCSMSCYTNLVSYFLRYTPSIGFHFYQFLVVSERDGVSRIRSTPDLDINHIAPTFGTYATHPPYTRVK